MAVAFDDEEMPIGVELDLVWHVERRFGRLAAITAVATFAGAGDHGGAAGGEVHAPDALVVEVAEVHRAVGSDDHTVGIGDFGVRQAGGAGADDRRHGRRPRDGDE